MKREIICISCPIGCPMQVEFGNETDINEENIVVSGNKCSRGEIYGKEEILSPKRMVTATVAIDSIYQKRVPVKTTNSIPKEMIDTLLDKLYQTKMKVPVKVGDKVLSDFNSTGIDVVVTFDLEK